jgi:hypothetical protein
VFPLQGFFGDVLVEPAGIKAYSNRIPKGLPIFLHLFPLLISIQTLDNHAISEDTLEPHAQLPFKHLKVTSNL